jgi:hypothetical protein
LIRPKIMKFVWTYLAEVRCKGKDLLLLSS